MLKKTKMVSALGGESDNEYDNYYVIAYCNKCNWEMYSCMVVENVVVGKVSDLEERVRGVTFKDSLGGGCFGGSCP